MVTVVDPSPGFIRDLIIDNFGEGLYCPCRVCKGTTIFLVPEMVGLLIRLRETFPFEKVTVVSGYRCPNHPDSLKRKQEERPTSQHTLGRAADLEWPDLWDGNRLSPTYVNIRSILRPIGFTGIGIGFGILHVDLRVDDPLQWNYDKDGQPCNYQPL